MKTNIVLIGMPGAGKSTVGVVLAKRLGMDFVDTDVLIQVRCGRRLQEIIDGEGLAAFRRIEERVLLELDVNRSVVATGGSVVYSTAGMRHLKESGLLFFLDVPLEKLTERVRNMDSRGIVIDPGEDFAGLYRRRIALYRRWADRVVDGAAGSVEEIAARIAGLTALDLRPDTEG